MVKNARLFDAVGWDASIVEHVTRGDAYARRNAARLREQSRLLAKWHNKETRPRERRAFARVIPLDDE